MQLQVVNDICGRVDRLEALLSSATPKAEAIIILGNLVAAHNRREAAVRLEHHQALPGSLKAALTREAADDRKTYQAIAEVLSSTGVPVFVIPGELDVPLPVLQEALLAASGALQIHFVHRRAASLAAGMIVAGFGGRLSATGQDNLLLHYPEWEAQVAFEHLHTSSPLFNLAVRRIFLFGTPLRSHRIDVEDAQHLGWPVLNRISRQYQPHLICCGGPAESRGLEIVDGLAVVNPGSLAHGSYATVTLDGEHIAVRIESLAETVDQYAQAKTIA